MASREAAFSKRWYRKRSFRRDSGQGAGPRLRGDTRAGSRAAMAAVAQACRTVSLSSSSSAAWSGPAAAAFSSTLYDCQGQQLLKLSR